MRLSDEQWSHLQPLIPKPIKNTKQGLLRRHDREVLEGILWVLRTGAQWDALPKGEYPSNSTCHERFQEWSEQAVFPLILAALYEEFGDREWLDLRETFTDGTFSPAKKEVTKSPPPRKAKAAKS